MFTKHISRQPQGQYGNATTLLPCSCRVTVLLLCSLFFTNRDCWVISHILYQLLEKQRFYSILFYSTLFFHKNNFIRIKALILATTTKKIIRTSSEQSQTCCPTQYNNKVSRLVILNIKKTKHHNRAWLLLHVD